MWFCRECGSSFEEPNYERDIANDIIVDLVTCPECEEGDVVEATDEDLEGLVKEFQEYIEEEGESYFCSSCTSINYYFPPISKKIKSFKEKCHVCGEINVIERS